MSLPWNKIIIHHSLTTDSQTLSWSAIRHYHTDPTGPPYYQMRDIGYHAGIELIGDSFEVLYGRPLDWIGAHCRGLNKTALGFLFVGNYDLTEPPPEMLKIAAERVLRPWMKAFNIPLHDIYGHTHFASYKTCPGSLFIMEHLRSVIRNLKEADFQ